MGRVSVVGTQKCWESGVKTGVKTGRFPRKTICLFTDLPICPSAYLPVCLPVCLSACLPICVSIHPSMFLYSLIFRLCFGRVKGRGIGLKVEAVA